MAETTPVPCMRHGGDIAQAMDSFGGETVDWLDLSTGINPYAWEPSGGREILVEKDWRSLPGRVENEALERAARQAYQVADTLTLVAAPGTEALLGWLARLAPAGDVAILAPTYSGHADAMSAAGRDVADVATLAEAASVRVTVVVNPNNPDGRALPPAVLLDHARRLAAAGGLLIVDEAFADVAPDLSVLPHIRDEPVVVLRSFGKFFGLAGLRLGFAAARPELAQALSASLGAWAVSGPACTLGRAALTDLDWQEAMRDRLTQEAAALDDVLTANGLDVVGGTNLFRLLSHSNAWGLHTALARRRIWTRCFSYRRDWLRIGLPPDTRARARLGGALKEALAETAAQTGSHRP